MLLRQWTPHVILIFLSSSPPLLLLSIGEPPHRRPPPRLRRSRRSKGAQVVSHLLLPLTSSSPAPRPPAAVRSAGPALDGSPGQQGWHGTCRGSGPRKIASGTCRLFLPSEGEEIERVNCKNALVLSCNCTFAPIF